MINNEIIQTTQQLIEEMNGNEHAPIPAEELLTQQYLALSNKKQGESNKNFMFHGLMKNKEEKNLQRLVQEALENKTFNEN